MTIFYLCNGKECPKVICAAEGVHYYADNRVLYSECKHTSKVEFAKNGPIKGPIDLIKRFKIHTKPRLYLEERG